MEMVVGEKHFNLKSVLSVLSAQITTSTEIDLICDGPEEERAMESLPCFWERIWTVSKRQKQRDSFLEYFFACTFK